MVRLSLVNLYLHGFTDPHIFEYDTLTSEERWNEFADVILANPPFMSPKGGIKPHKRFSIQAKRSEVLFVDYMAEHLTPTGRAAIIVPEGIIFQSQTAYKELRKMLVANSLVAVVSLPAGCFNPYSGVKTSILILDKSLARQSDTVAFFKVENDGFGLGAQRRAIGKNDLPQVQAELAAYLQALRAKSSIKSVLSRTSTAQIVLKETIAANGDYNLSGERYRKGAANLSTFPLVRLEEVFTKISNGVNVTQVDEAAKYRVSRIQTIADGSVNLDKTKFTNDEVKPESFLQPGDILLSHINSFDHLGKTAIFLESAADVIHGINLIRLVPDPAQIDPRFALRVFKTDRFIDTVKSFAQKAVNQASVKTSDLRAIQIPLPPLELQKEIVTEIEGYQKVINGARAVLDHYRPHIPIHPDWPMVPLGDVCTIKSGGTPDRSKDAYWNGDIPWVTTTLIDYEIIDRANEYVTSEGLKNSATWVVPKGTVLMAMYGQGVTRGRVAILGIDAAINQACAVFQLKGDSIDNGYLFRVLQSRYEDLRKVSDARGGNQSNLSAQVLKTYLIPVPPFATQRAIVAEIDAEQVLVASNRELITRFEQKIQATLARVWGKDEAPSAGE